MKNIEIKKSQIALLKKAFSKTNEEIAAHFGITTKEALDALMHFDLIKGRKATKTPEYTISYNDDTTNLVSTPVATTETVESNA